MDSDLDVRRRRALYRAQHRGTKEMDLILGRFAAATLAGMTAEELTRFEAFLALPDPDLQNAILTGEGLEAGALSGLMAELRRFHGIDGQR